MNPFQKIIDVDLDEGVKTVDLGTIVFENDNNSNRFGARVFKSGVVESMSGSIKGKVIRPDGATVTYNSGTISGNIGYITLTKDAFVYPGQIKITVKFLSGTDEITIASFRATVVKTETGQNVNPGSVYSTVRSVNGITADNTGNITIPNANTSASGLMSAADKTKLDAMAPAEYNTAFGSLSDFFAIIDEKANASGMYIVPIGYLMGVAAASIGLPNGGYFAVCFNGRAGRRSCRFYNLLNTLNSFEYFYSKVDTWDTTLHANSPVTVDMGTVTGTGGTVTVTKGSPLVNAAMTVDRIIYGTPSAVDGEATVTTATSSVTFSAKVDGSTTVKIKLSSNVNVTGT